MITRSNSAGVDGAASAPCANSRSFTCGSSQHLQRRPRSSLATIAGGSSRAPARRTTSRRRNPGTPDSAIVGTSGAEMLRLALVTAIARRRPGFHVLPRGRHRDEHELHLPADRVDDRRSAALVRHVHHVDAGLQLEELARDVRRRADADGRVVELARVRLGVRDQLLDAGDGNRRVDDEDLRNHRGEAHRHEIALDVERQLLVELRVDRVRRQREQDRVAVGRRFRDDVGAEIAGGAAAVVDDDRLAELRRQRLDDDARNDVGAAARRIRDDELDRPGGIVLRDGRSGQCEAAKQSTSTRERRLFIAEASVSDRAIARRQAKRGSAFRRRRSVLREMARRQRQRVAPERVAQFARHHHLEHRRLALVLRLRRRAQRRADVSRASRSAGLRRPSPWRPPPTTAACRD